jgi:AIPR protein
MPRNDIVLLDSLITKARLQLGEQHRESEIFELFCFDQVLKDYELSYEELESGWTDGPDDGGVDGFFVFLDGHLVSEPKGEHAARWNPTMSVTLFTVRHSDSFQQEPLNALCGSLPELVDFRKTEGELQYPFRTELLAQRALFRKLFVSLADRRPKLHLRVCYCCRGDTSTLADNIVTRAERAKETIREFFSELDVTVELLGATELLAIARRQKTYTLRLRFLESYISREGKNYVILVSLPNYFQFVTDEQGQLRRYLFDSNVRDYLGQVQINRDIDQTLDRECAAVDEDFWWLNNGVTILATHAMVIGKELAIESVQIVNGLQTTESIYRHFTRTGLKKDDRAILVKILLATDENTRGRIIKATNYQNTVDLANLRGLDKIQIDIDHFLAEKG